jgi:hypothetical protein
MGQDIPLEGRHDGGYQQDQTKRDNLLNVLVIQNI